jgi:hypothetical protein
VIINLEKDLEKAETVDELRSILRVVVNALNTIGDAKGQVRGDMVFHDSGPVLRADDGNYYRIGIVFVSGSPTMSYTLVGKNPIGE